VTQVANKNTAGDDKGDYAISSDFQQSFLQTSFAANAFHWKLISAGLFAFIDRICIPLYAPL
jgi:hypothetical protein